MSTYKIIVNDRGYTSWEIFENSKFNKVSLNINPIEHKLFSNDVFLINDNLNIELLHSTVRTGSPMPAVLILNDNKTYGRQKTPKGKLMYKCIPDDMRIPPFLIPYEMKHIGFSKVFTNLYVTITFHEWIDKHPIGILNNVIGPVDILDNYYEYQLYCKSLNTSIQKFQKDTINAVKKASHEAFIESIKVNHPSIEDRTNQSIWNVFTIDPPKSLDYDDGFSIIEKEDGIKQLSIYISNVTVWMDVLNLWDSFSRRISTIYLPDKKRPMLPTVLSDCLCSLQENVTRIAFVMDIFIKDTEIIEIKYSNCFIKVFKNYCYEEPELLNNDKFKQLLNTTKNLSKKFKYINSVRNSHETVTYLMILMNYHCAKEMIKHNAGGVFRSTIMKRDCFVPETVPDDVAKFIKIWNSASGQYVNGSEIINQETSRHELLDMDAYIHITSPIRRLVDLLNIIKFQEISGIIRLSNNAQTFYNKWLSDLEYINTTMRSIRKVQCDCTLLDLCANNPSVMEKEYEGYLFDKIIRNDGLFQYIVFLPELKLSSRITLRDNLENFSSKKIKLFLFNDEENFKKKIRLHVL
uniref:RNB domain-containing protein n=1 Tax=viral metagenome TaxID=1070528 RepID=A0A6C0EQB6_9ZZZZ